jgi:surface polysaccharide O-acyltransferase-like enzyme
MSPTELVLILALVGYAVYRQTRKHELAGKSRFKLAIIYGIVGLAVGGLALPHGSLALLLFAASIALSLVVGFVRGRYTRIWREGDRLYAQGTTFTVTLFLLMVAAKFGLGTVAYFAHVSADGGLGEILLMIAVMVAVQAEYVWRRAQALLPAGGSYATSSR